MKKRIRIILLGVIILLVGGLAWLIFQGREPVYQGKTLSEWLDGYKPSQDDETIEDARRRAMDADNAIRHIGTNGFPMLAKMFRAKDSKLKRAFIALSEKQSLIHFNFTTDEDRHALALRGLGALESNAAPLIPVLTQSMNDNEPEIRYFAALAIARMGIIGIQPLTNALAGTNQRIRGIVTAVLGQYRESTADDWLTARLAPAEFATVDERIIPILLGLLKDADPTVECYAISSLGQIRRQPETVVPALIDVLENSSSKLHWTAIRALARFGKDARSAVPALTHALQDPDKDVRIAALAALKKVDPEAAAQAEEK